MACFADITVSQGSVATYAMCGGTFNIDLTANLPRNLPVKTIFKSVKIWQKYGHESVAPFFGPPCSDKCAGLWNCRASVRPSVPSCAATAACGDFASAAAISIDCCTALLQQRSRYSIDIHSSTAVSSKCEQCHVYSRRSKLNTATQIDSTIDIRFGQLLRSQCPTGQLWHFPERRYHTNNVKVVVDHRELKVKVIGQGQGLGLKYVRMHRHSAHSNEPPKEIQSR